VGLPKPAGHSASRISPRRAPSRGTRCRALVGLDDVDVLGEAPAEAITSGVPPGDGHRKWFRVARAHFLCAFRQSPPPREDLFPGGEQGVLQKSGSHRRGSTVVFVDRVPASTPERAFGCLPGAPCGRSGNGVWCAVSFPAQTGTSTIPTPSNREVVKEMCGEQIGCAPSPGGTRRTLFPAGRPQVDEVPFRVGLLDAAPESISAPIESRSSPSSSTGGCPRAMNRVTGFAQHARPRRSRAEGGGRNRSGRVPRHVLLEDRDAVADQQPRQRGDRWGSPGVPR
jgi:hypothetical protein